MEKIELFIMFEQITEQIIDLDIISVDIIEKVEDLIDQRKQLIEKIDASEGDLPSEVLKRVVQKNIQAETKLEEILLNIKGNIEMVVNEKTLSNKKKKAHRGYLNPGHQNDGYFIDKKK
ncbi:MAG: hypothetical protein JEZ08_20465 [Clostridiales bacterium]|nr:hypothetical protein [Clostridiales bacterium]